MKEIINVALPKGRLGEKVYDIFDKAGYSCPSILETNRKLIFESEENSIRYFWVKPSDVAIYVERGAADIGVAGKDILLEYEPDVYELLDLNMGKCRMCVAGPASAKELLKTNQIIRVASKYPKIAKDYFYNKKHQNVEIVKLNGSVELAPIVGLSEVIVDIVETGSTLRENGLEVLEEICPLSARVIVNEASMKMQRERITKIVKDLKNTLTTSEN